MDAFINAILKMGGTVLEIKDVCDVRPTVQSKQRIMHLLQSVDPKFHTLIKDFYGSFSYGDKYFYPIGESELLCIPLNVEDLEGWAAKNVTGDFNVVHDDFLSFNQRLKESGYFDISTI